MRCSIFLLCLLMLPAVPVVAQDIPDQIPDTPEETPADRIRKRLTEENRHALAPLFVSTVASAALPGSLGSDAREIMFYGGIQRLSRDAVYVGIGTRSYRLDGDLVRDVLDRRRGSATILAAGYEFALQRMAPGNVLARDLHLGIGIGAVLGDVYEGFVELHPTYQFRIGPRWTLPVGVKLGAGMARADDVSMSRAMVAASIGLRLNLLQHDILR